MSNLPTTLDSWHLVNPATNTWTDLAVPSRSAVLNSIYITANANAANVDVRVTDLSGNARFTLVPVTAIAANSGNGLLVNGFVLKDGEKLQARSSAANVEFSAHGEILKP